MFTRPLWKVPQEPVPAEELIALRYPKSKPSARAVWHGRVTCSDAFPARPRFALSWSPALCCCIYWAFLNDKIELILRPLLVSFKTWLLLSGSGLRCSVSHLDCFIGYLFSVNHINNLKLNRKNLPVNRNCCGYSCSSWIFKNIPVLDKSNTELFSRWIFCSVYFCWLWRSFFWIEWLEGNIQFWCWFFFFLKSGWL